MVVQHVKDKPYELLAFLPYRVTAAQFLGGVGPLPGVICLIDQENEAPLTGVIYDIPCGG